jgi:hypothetical protein
MEERVTAVTETTVEVEATGVDGETTEETMGEGGGEEMDERQAGAGGDLAALREALLRAYPRAVPELVTGASVSELLASLDPALAAWERVAAGVTTERGAAIPPPVPAGDALPPAADPERLPATEKIRRGLMGRRV